MVSEVLTSGVVVVEVLTSGVVVGEVLTSEGGGLLRFDFALGNGNQYTNYATGVSFT